MTGDEASAGLRGGSVLLAGRLLSVVMGFVTQVVLVRSLTKDDFGLFALGLAVVAAVRIAVSLGHNRVIARFFALYRERGDGARLLGTLVLEACLITALGAVAVAVAVAVWTIGGRDDELAALLAFFVVLAPLEALEELLENLFAAFGRVRTILLRQHVIAPLLRLTVVVVLALTGAGIGLVAVGYLLATAVGVAVYALVLRRLVREDGVLAARSGPLEYPAREIFGYAAPLLSTELVYLSTGSLNAVLLGALRGATAVAGLRAVQPFADVNLLVRRQFHRLFLSVASVLHDRGDTAGLRDAYWRNAAWTAVLTFPLFALTGPLAGPLTTLLLGERYADAAPYLALLSTALYANAAAGFNAEVLQAAARVRWLLVVNLVTAAVVLAGSAAAAPGAGALGVAGATAAGVVVQNVLNQLGLRAVLGSALPPRRYARVHLVVLLAGAALFALAAAASPAGVLLAAAAVASLAVLLLTRGATRMAEALPALARVPVLGRLL